MSKKLGVRSAVAAAFLALSGASHVAFAISEVEPNDSLLEPQQLLIGSGGTVEVTGELLTPAGATTPDADYYRFVGNAGDIVTIDIDGGMKAADSSSPSVDTFLTVYSPAGDVLRENDDGLQAEPADPGSVFPMGMLDALLEGVVLPTTGEYTIGVSVPPSAVGMGLSNGSYSLLISGVSMSVVEYINIKVKPGSEVRAPLNPKAKAHIPVALLTSASFNALQVDRSSLTFGASGDEASLVRCNQQGSDADGDGDLDLVCYFNPQDAGFEVGDLEGTVKGKMASGGKFEGSAPLMVWPQKRAGNQSAKRGKH